ncbi:hypothetical protein U1Q18_012498 [Sarracenia purpurea var. burkii]
MNPIEELSGLNEEEKDGLKKDQNISSVTSYDKNSGGRMQTADLTEGSSTGFEKLRDISNKDENMESQGRAWESQQKTKEATESRAGAKDELGSSLITAPKEETTPENAGPDVSGNLEDNSIIACEEASQETVELSKKMEDATSIEDQERHLKSSFVKIIEDEPDTGIHEETRNDETSNANDINVKEIQEGKNLSTADFNEKTRSAELEIPSKNGNELYMTHPPIEEKIQVRGEKQDEFSIPVPGHRVDEVLEVPKEEEKHVNETYEASKSPENTLVKHTSTDEEVNMEVTSTTSVVDINIEKDCELKSEGKSKEINFDENREEEVEQKQKASDIEIQVGTKCDDNVQHIIEEDVPVKNRTPLCTREEEYYHDQEEKIRADSSNEASPELDSGDQSCRTPNQINNINEQIINEETTQTYEDPKTADRIEDPEKKMKKEHIVRDTEKAILEHANNFEGSTKELNQRKKAPLEFEEEGNNPGSEASVIGSVNPHTEEKREEEDKELTSNLSNKTVNEVHPEDKKEVGSWLGQPPETIKILEIENMPANILEVANVNIVDEGNVGTIEGEPFSKSTSVTIGKTTKNTEENQLIAKEEMSGFQEEEEEEQKGQTDKNNIVEASCGKNTGFIIQTIDLTEGSSINIEKLREDSNEEKVDNASSTKTTSSDLNSRETSFEGEHKTSNIFSNLMSTEVDPEKIQPCTNVEDENNKGEEMLCAGIKDVCTANETACQDNPKAEEPTEISVGAKDNLGCSLVNAPVKKTNFTKVGPEACKNLEENSSTAFKEESEETDKLSENTKDAVFIEDEVQNKNLESSFLKRVEESFQKVDNLETSTEESETGTKDVDNEKQNEADDNEIHENIITAESNLSTSGKDDEHPDQEADDSFKKPDESTMRESEDSRTTEALTIECKHEGDMAVAGDDNVGAEEREKIEISIYEEHSEQSFMQKTEPTKGDVGSPLDGASEKTERTVPDGYTETIANIEQQGPINIPEEILGETRKDETAIAHDTKEIQEAKDLSTLDLENEVSISESGDQFQATLELPKEEAKHINETYEASKNPESIILEHASTEGEINMEMTSTTDVMDIKLEKSFELNPEEKLEEVNAKEDVKEEVQHKEAATDAEFEVVTKSDVHEKGTIEENSPLKNNTSCCTGEEDYPHDQEDKIRPNSSKEVSPELDSEDQIWRTANKIKNINDQIINEEVCEDPKIADGIKDTEKLMKNEHTVTDCSPESTHEHPTKSCQENETEAENRKAEIGQELTTTSEGQSTEKQVLAQENRVQDSSTVPIREELDIGGSKEEGMMTEVSKEEVLGIIQSDNGRAKIGIQTKEEDGKEKDNLVACGGEETENKCSYDLEQEKEQDTPVPRETDRAVESEIIKEETIEEQSCTEELHMITAADETVNESLEETAANINSELMESKNAEDLNKESEASPMKKALQEEIKKVGKPTDVSSSVCEGLGEKIKKENIEKRETCDDETAIAPTAVIEEPNLGEIQQNEEPVKTIDTSSDSQSPQATNTTHTSQHDTKFDSMVCEIPVHENEKEDTNSITVRKSAANDIEIEDTKILDAVSKSKDQNAEGFNERITSLNAGETQTNETEKQIRETPEELSEAINQDVEAVIEDEIIAPMVAREISSLEEVQLSDEYIEALETSSGGKNLETTKTADTNQQDAEASSVKLEETSIVLPQLPIHEHEPAYNENIAVEKSTANDVEVEETKILEEVSESKDQCIEEFNERSTSLSAGETHTNEAEKQIREAPEELSEAINHGVEAVTEDKIIAQTVSREVSSSEELRLSDEHVKVLDTCPGGNNLETTKTADTNQQNTEIDSAKLEETTIILPQLPIHEPEKAYNENIFVRKSDSNSVEVEETKIPDAASESKDQAFKEIHETGTNLTVGETDSNEIEKQISQVPETLLETINQGVDATIDDEISPSQTLQSEKIEEQPKFPSSCLLSEEQESNTAPEIEKTQDGSTKKDVLEVGNLKFEENSGHPPDQEDEIRPNSSAEASPELDSGDQSWRTSNEIKNINDQIINEEAIQVYEDPMIADRVEDTAKKLEKEHTVTDRSLESTGEHTKCIQENETEGNSLKAEIGGETTSEFQGTEKQVQAEELDSESSKKDAIIEVSKEEVLGIIQSDNGSAKIGIQTKEEDGKEKDNLVARGGEETENKCSYDLEQEKEQDTPVPREIDRAVESEIIKEETIEEQSCTEELHMITAADETVNESLEETAANINSELMESKNTEDLNKESEASPMKKVLEEEIKKVGKPTDVSGSVSEGLGEKIKKENIEERETCDDETAIAPTAVTEEPILGEIQLNDEPVKTIDTSADSQSPQATNTTHTSQHDTKFDSMVSEIPVHENEKEDTNSITVRKSAASDIEIEDTKILDAVSKSKDQNAEVFNERITSLNAGETHTNETEKQIRETLEELSEAINQDVEAVIEDEIIAPMVAREISSLEEVQLSDEYIEALETSSGGKNLETTKTADTSQQDAEASSVKLEETSIVLPQLPIHEHEPAYNENIAVEKSTANDVEVEETKILEVSGSKDQCIEEFNERSTSLSAGETHTNEAEKQIREAPEELSEAINHGVEAVTEDEIIAQTVSREVSSSEELRLSDEHVKVIDTCPGGNNLETTKTADTNQQNTEIDSAKLEETSIILPQLPIHEPEEAYNENIFVRKSDSNSVEVEETKIPDAASESKDQAFKEIQETGTNLTVGETDSNEIEKQTSQVPEALLETINQGVDTTIDDKISPSQTLQPEKIEEQPKFPSSCLLSEEQESNTAPEIEKTQDGSTKKDGLEVGNLKLEENCGTVSQLQIAECESTNNTIINTSDVQDVEFKETETSDAVSESKDQGLEEIWGIRTSPTAKYTETDKIKDEIKGVTEKISDPRYQGVDTAADGETLDHPLKVGKVKDQLEVPSSALFLNILETETGSTIEKIEGKSIKKDGTEVSKIELEEATSMFSKFPTTDICNMSANTQKSGSDEVQGEEAKTSEVISEFKGHVVEESHEIGPNSTMGKTHIDEVREDIKAVPETIFDPNDQAAEAVIDADIAINQTLTTQIKEQLQEPSSALLKEQNHETATKVEIIKDESTKKHETQPDENVVGSFAAYPTEKPCLRDKGLRELQVSNLEQKVQEDIQDESREEESTTLEKDSTAEPQEHSPEIECTEEVGEKSEEASNLEVEKAGGVLEFVPENSPEVPPLSKGIEVVKELLTGSISELRDEKSEEASNLEVEKAGGVLEFVPENSPEVPPISEGIEVIKEQLTRSISELRDGKNHCKEATEADEAVNKYTSQENVTNKISKEKQVSRNLQPATPQEESIAKTNQEDELREDYLGERTTITLQTPRKEVEQELFEESAEAGADKSKEAVIADARISDNPFKVSVGDGTANANLPEEAKDGQNIEKAPNKLEVDNQDDELNFRDPDAAMKATAPIKERNNVMFVSHEEDRTSDNDEETVMSKDEQLENTDLSVPQVTDAATKEVPDEKVGENFDEFTESAPRGPTHGIIETYDENLEIAKQDDFMPDKQTMEVVSGKGFKFEERIKDEELVELSAMEKERKLDEAKVQGTIAANEEEETQEQNEKPNVLSDIKASGTEVSHEMGLMDIANVTQVTNDTQGLEKTSLAISHEQNAGKTDPNEGIETTNSTARIDELLMQADINAEAFRKVEIRDLKAGYASGSEPEAKGIECGEEKRMGKESEETTEKATMIESAKNSLSDLMQRSTKQTFQMAEHLVEERELTGNKKEQQTETADTVRVDEAKTDENKDDEEDGDEQKREDSGSDAPVMVEASKDMDVVKISHKKSHNILSGVGSKVKHSLAKVKKVITGKSSHPKPQSPK